MTRFYLLLISSTFLLFPLIAQDDKDKKWDVNDPPGDWGWKDISIPTDEGTWMSLDVSPDGKSIVFDMLGDIYIMPIQGGEAKALRTGIAWEIQPRFSPDGKKILFTSDAGNGDNIWVMDRDGENAKQLTKETFRLLNNPVWSPDGEYFVARKHFTSQRSLGAGEMWLYHRTGGAGTQLTKRKNDQQDVNEPCISPDGRYVYFSEDMYPGGYFQYNKDPNSQIYVIKRFDRQEDKIETVVSGPGGAARPQISRDGKKLAYVRRVRTKSVLFVRDLETGESYPIYEDLDKDQQEAWAIFGVYPGFAWTPDDSHIVIWAKGKLWKVPTDPQSEANPMNIPFSATIKTKVAETAQFKNEVFTDDFDVKVIRHAVTSPDGKTVAFSALGQLWQTNLETNTTSSLYRADDAFAFEPAFSPDGNQLVFVTWSDQNKGQIVVMNLRNNATTVLNQQKGLYRTPAFSPDGKTIVYRKDGGNQHQGFTYTHKPGMYTVAASGGEASFVLPNGEYPSFSTDGKRIYFQTGGFLFGSLTKEFHSVKLDGTDEKTHIKGKYAQRFSISPDNNWIAWSELHKVYVAPFPKSGKTLSLTRKTKIVPVAQVAKDAGINIHWSPDSKQLHWTLGNEYFEDDLTDRFSFLEGAQDELPPIDSVGQRIQLNVPMDKPEGKIAMTNARIITMEGDEVIENGTIIIENNVIDRIGPSNRVRVPQDAKVIDCTGKTIMPGIVDAHAHAGDFRYGLSPEQNWYYYANLAYGVTTAHDPSSNSEMIFSHSEMIKAGRTVGPRLFSTGTILYGADGDFKAPIETYEDALSAIRRTKAYGAFSVKSYNQPRRDQRQKVMRAAKELEIIVVPEGGSTFNHNMNMLHDGHTGVEHNIPVAPLYKDVVDFWAATEAHNTPTLIVNYGGLNGEYYWYQKTNVWEKDRLLRFTPRQVVDSRARHRTMVPDEEYENGHILVSQSCTKLQNAGVNINLGAHGQLQGLGAHWELWLIAQGGMSNLQALKTATINGARYLGMDHQIGSLKKGKLADLIVLDANPLEDIHNSEQVRYTMINGRLYDAATMNEIGNREKERQPFYFEQEGSGNAWPMWTDGVGAMPAQCSCRH